MNISIEQDEFDLIRQYIEQECGIALENDKTYLIESRLSRMVLENGCDNFREFYQKAKNDTSSQLRDKIVDAMTTNETLWFRDNHPYEVLKTVLFPKFVEQLRNKERPKIRIWSAACSTGQEPYSIGILAHEYAKAHNAPELINGGIEIIATDISTSALFIAKNARYDGISMSRGMSPDIQSQYFAEAGRAFQLNDEIKKMVQFQQFNLQNSFVSLGSFDLVMIRNVAIYFSADFKKDLYAKIATALNPGGYMFLGSSESLMGYSDAFDLLKADHCLYYQKRMT
ncbi:MAG: protein-glutamate O-methyltransferase CheR [Vampirovibrio sp.]|nr:protein-glutamate O-methyltransferase CheR [Vampirovibrio sp.]